jgi:hypothetical protein
MHAHAQSPGLTLEQLVVTEEHILRLRDGKTFKQNPGAVGRTLWLSGEADPYPVGKYYRKSDEDDLKKAKVAEAKVAETKAKQAQAQAVQVEAQAQAASTSADNLADMGTGTGSTARLIPPI